jgi:hypothetical protein
MLIHWATSTNKFFHVSIHASFSKAVYHVSGYNFMFRNKKLEF